MAILSHHCDRCGKRFSLDNETTLNDMRELRIVLIRNDYWHVPCANVRRTNDGGIDILGPSQGRLIRIQERGVAQQ